MEPLVASNPWSEEALLSKARLYTDKMESFTTDDWEYGLWSALTLELTARAALAHISPALLAGKDNWRNIAFSLGHQPTQKGFSPVSIPANEVISRLSELRTEITPDISDFCAKHLARRNSELHTGELAFAGLGTSTWLPNYYQALKALLAIMGKTLQDMIANPRSAETLVESILDKAAATVRKDIAAHKQVWDSKSAEDRESLVAQAAASASRHIGHRVSCPACSSLALLHGSPTGAVSTEVVEVDGDVVQRQSMLPTSFECNACGLRISGVSRLSACGLGDAFTGKTTYSAAEFFGLYTEDEVDRARAEAHIHEEDFNEY
jgi:hypothetical protein